MADDRGFPRTETLKSGLAVTIRPVRADDREKIAAAVRNLDRESIYFRLFSYRTELTERRLDRIMAVDPTRDAMLVVTVGDPSEETVIASGRFVGSLASQTPRTAEIAFVVEEDYQGLGIAGRLLRHLAAIAREKGLVALEADVLADNKAMLGVFSRSGLPMRKRQDGGTVHVTLSLRGDQG